jgi:hypothetical protein
MPEPLARDGKDHPLHFAQYRPFSQGGPEVFMEAILGGELQVRGRCLGLYLAESDAFYTIVWTAAARLGTDGEGVFVTEGAQRFRPGDEVIGGGGTMPQDFSDHQLVAPFPKDCRGKGAVQLYGLKPPEKGAVEPQPAPPPPPKPD